MHLKKAGVRLHTPEDLSQQPRERLKTLGAPALADQELLAILLRTGSASQSVTVLAQTLLDHFETLYDFKLATLEELQEIKGIGPIKALELQAMMELGRRITQASQLKQGRVLSSQALGEMMIAEMKDYQQEHLVALYLNSKNEITRKETLYIGTLNQSIAHPREIFRFAVKYAAARIILVHNHPSGDVQPSMQDIQFTQRVAEAGKLLGIEIMDHLIVSHAGYYSLREERILD